MTADELQEKLQESYPLLTWKVTANAKGPAGLAAYHNIEWWEIDARVTVDGVEIGTKMLDEKDCLATKGEIVSIGQRIAYSIGYEIMHYSR